MKSSLLSHIHRALAAVAPGRRDEGLDQRPLGIRKVARVAQPRTIMGLPLLHRPYRAPPPGPTSTANLLPWFGNLPDGLYCKWIY